MEDTTHTAEDTKTHHKPNAVVHADNVLNGVDALLEPQDTDSTHLQPAPALHRATHVLHHPWLAKIKPPKHSAHTSQPSLLSTLRPPPIRYVPTLPRRVAKSGALSELQLEALLLIGQRHTSTRLASGARPGFLLADGPGVGKGRTQAAVILDAWLQGHQRALWVSASADLVADAHRDLKAVCTASPGMPPLHDLLIPLIGVSHTSAIREPQGIVFVSYALLARPARLAQVLAWCEGGRKDYEGVVTLDECHRAKAAGATGVGTAVLRLQAELPLARVIYASATAATEVHNMRYLTRLGLWGAGTGSSSFNDFRDSITEAGAAAVELLPLHLKAIGAFACRTISFQGVSIAIATHELTDDQRRMYDRSAEVWRALARTLGSRSADLPASATSRFWSAHQRFFRLLVTASKLPLLHETLNRGLAQGKSVVVGLLGTGEAYGEAAARHANEATADAMLPFVDLTADDVVPGAACSPGEGEPALPSAPAAILRTTITTVIYPNVPQDDERVAKLLAQIDSLKLPPNPLDAIMARLASEGVESVELSGRAEVAALRNTLRERFQLGQARVAVISDAASTGISLHAPVPPEGEPVRPRLHVTLELNWSADRQIQQLGRTHRTGQACPPEHVLLVSDVGGEQRFVSTVARRLQSLGALSGDDGVSRDGGVSQRAEGRWSDVLHSLETAEGSAALLHLYRALNYGGSEAFDSELGVSRRLLRDYFRLRVRLDKSIDEGDEAQARRAALLFVPKADLAAASQEDPESEPEVYDVTDDDDEHDGDDTAAKAPPETLEEDAVEGAPEAIPFANDRHVRLVRSKLNKCLRRAVREMLPISRAQSPAPCAAPGAASPALPLPRSKATSVPLFLNRLLGLCIDDQRELLDLFTFLMARSRECTTPERRGGSDGGLSWYVGRGAMGAVEGWARTGRIGALSGADTLLPSALILGRVHRVAATSDASLYVFQLEELAPGYVAYGAARAAVEDQRADGFYAQRGGSGSDCFLRFKRASKRSPSPSTQPPEQWVLSASGERLPLSRAPQPLEPIGLGEAKLRWDAHAKRAEDALRAAATLAPERPTTFLLCGALLFSLERVRRLLGNRPLALGRAMLATGQVAVGIVLDEDVAHSLLSQAPSSAEVGVVEAALPEREQQRWAVALAEALATQRSLQRALPVHDATQAWERCWAEIKQYETADLDTEELVERQRMEDALKDFQLDIERRKRARRQPPGALHANAARPHPSVVHGGASGSLATIAARAAAHGETTVPGPLFDSVEPSESVPPAPAMPGDIATAILSTGLHSETKPPRGALPTIRRTPNFSPATKSVVRTSSAAKRAAAKSKLHPLLQIASESADS